MHGIGFPVLGGHSVPNFAGETASELCPERLPEGGEADGPAAAVPTGLQGTAHLEQGDDPGGWGDVAMVTLERTSEIFVHFICGAPYN